MSLATRTRQELRMEIFSLADIVAKQLKVNPDIDDFLDNTTLFDAWEEVLPDQEYAIFVITVLNNIRRESIIDVIIDAAQGRIAASVPTRGIPSKKLNALDSGHPFC